MEAAASLRQRGLNVTVIAPEEQPLELILGKEMGRRLRSLHEEHGVNFRLGRKPTEFRRDSVLLDDGSAVEASAVVVGVGVRPRLDLAKAAGASTDNGVLTDEYLQSSVAGIWAAGDIASWPDAHTGERNRVEHWAVAQRQGATAARNILGKGEPYREVPFFWSQQYDLVVTYVGSGKGWDAIQVSGNLDDNDALVAYRKDGRIIAVAAIFRDVDSLNAEVAMERDDQAALEALVR
jgi:NADPH-dependent 2,4-dienoyl-CoA reductase/sulfur reductase-like enzyme